MFNWHGLGIFITSGKPGVGTDDSQALNSIKIVITYMNEFFLQMQISEQLLIKFQNRKEPPNKKSSAI